MTSSGRPSGLSTKNDYKSASAAKCEAVTADLVCSIHTIRDMGMDWVEVARPQVLSFFISATVLVALHTFPIQEAHPRPVDGIWDGGVKAGKLFLD